MTLTESGLPNLFRILREAADGQPLYLVGGSVRDLLLGRPVKDLDLALPGSVERYGRRLADALGGAFFYLRQADQTARIVFSNADASSASLFASVRQIDLVLLHGQSLEDDLRRRDFTINALGLDLSGPLPPLTGDGLKSAVVDPLGGLNDLRDRILRRCSARSLLDDPLRAMRAARFAVSFNAEIERDTREQIVATGGNLCSVSAERIRDELFFMLDLSPRREVERGLRLLQELGLLDAALRGPLSPHGFANLARLDRVLSSPTVAESPVAAPLDAYLSETLTPPRSRASLLHLAAILEPNGGWTPQDRQQPGLLHQRLALSSAEIQWIGRTWKGALEALVADDSAEDSPSALRSFRFFRRFGDAIPSALILATAWAYPDEIDPRWESTCLQVLHAWFYERERYLPSPLLDGRDLIKAFQRPGGPWIARLLDALQEAQAQDRVQTETDAWAFVSEIMESEAVTPPETP